MKNKILILLLLLFGSSRVGYSQVFFNYTGGSQNYVVPAGVTVICFTVEGAQGNGNASNLMLGGLGGQTTGQLLVTPGQVLQINVGGGGLGNSTPGGFNGGAQVELRKEIVVPLLMVVVVVALQIFVLILMH